MGLQKLITYVKFVIICIDQNVFCNYDIYKGQFFKIVHILLILYHMKPDSSLPIISE